MVHNQTQLEKNRLAECAQSKFQILGNSQANTDVQAYFEFVRDVLGVQNILLVENEKNHEIMEAVVGDLPSNYLEHALIRKSVFLLIVVESLYDYTSSEIDLLNKMVAALRLAPEKYKIIEKADEIQYTNLFRLNFVDQIKKKIAAEPVSISLKFQVETYSPRILAQQPSLKKQVWAQMQILLQKMNHEASNP